MNTYQDIDAEQGQLGQEAKRFFENGVNRGHARRGAGRHPLEEIRRGLLSGRGVAERSLGLTGGDGLLVLDVGCSWGPVVVGAARSERVSAAIGVDIEDEALRL